MCLLPKVTDQRLLPQMHTFVAGGGSKPFRRSSDTSGQTSLSAIRRSAKHQSMAAYSARRERSFRRHPSADSVVQARTWVTLLTAAAIT